MNKNVMIGTLAIALAITMFGLFAKKHNIQQKDNLIEALGDSLETWKDKDGKNTAKIQILETQNLRTFIQLGNTNKTLQELQKLVKENSKLLKRKGSATIIKTETKIDTFIKTEVIRDSTGITFKGNYKDEWLDIESTSNKDSTIYALKSYSQLSLVLGNEKQGLFKKSKPYAIVKDQNPFTNISDMKTYRVSSPKKKKFTIGPSVGYGIMFTNEGIKSGIIIGGTVTYNLINF